jgi:osmotically-inducible protein OsmY
MSKNRILLAAAASLMFFAGTAFADGKSAGQTVDDSALVSKTKLALIENQAVPGRDINVEANKGRVLLGGMLETDAQKKAALATAAGAAGGSANVIDALVVVAKDRSVGVTLDDTTTQAKLKAELLDKLGQGVSINTEVRRGEALMSGFVNLEGTKTKAGEIAKGIPGVKKVHNRLVVAK